MENRYKGMTVNERLYISGLMDQFDDAVKKKDLDKVISILKAVELNNESIKPILTSVDLKSDDI